MEVKERKEVEEVLELEGVVNAFFTEYEVSTQ